MDRSQLLNEIKADSLVERMLGVAKLDVKTYEAIEADTGAIPQAAAVVGIVALAGGIGALADNGLLGLAFGFVAAFVGWVLFSYVTYFVGTRLLGGPATQATPEELMRVLGFAQAPSVLAVFGLIPILGGLVAFVGSIWALVTAIVAIRQALEVSTGRAIAIGLVAAIATGLVIAIVAVPLGIGAMVAF